MDVIKNESLTFEQLGVIFPFAQTLEQLGYNSPTPIQKLGIPLLLSGKDVIGCAQTGTGKTCAFALPILQKLYEMNDKKTMGYGRRSIRVLTMSPTRELATQVHESFCTYSRGSGLRSCCVFGGVPQKPQTDQLERQQVDILVATPGRLIDLHDQGFIDFGGLKFFVLDEADQMLDMGFIVDIRRILSILPPKEKRQNAFFSATVPPEVVQLSRDILQDDFEQITIAPEQKTAERVSQELYHVENMHKFKLLVWLLRNNPIGTTLIFVRTKRGANRLADLLNSRNIKTDSIHGDKTQNQRTGTLKRFKLGKVRCLVATDIAARGLDIDDLRYVYNYDLPATPETYIHRIGRTGRASKSGKAISLCVPDQRPLLNQVEKEIKMSIPVGAHDMNLQSGPSPTAPVRNQNVSEPFQHQNDGRYTKPKTFKKDDSRPVNPFPGEMKHPLAAQAQENNDGKNQTTTRPYKPRYPSNRNNRTNENRAPARRFSKRTPKKAVDQDDLRILAK